MAVSGCVPGILCLGLLRTRLYTAQDGCASLRRSLHEHNGSKSTGSKKHCFVSRFAGWKTLSPRSSILMSAYQRSDLREFSWNQHHFSIFCSPILELQDGICFMLLRVGHKKCAKKSGTLLREVQSNHLYTTASLGQVEGGCSLKHGM